MERIINLKRISKDEYVVVDNGKHRSFSKLIYALKYIEEVRGCEQR